MFIQTLREHNVTLSSASVPFLVMMGITLWAAPFVFYLTGAFSSQGSIVRPVWITDCVIHVAVGALVVVEASVTEGLFWPLQTAIIGGATFVTFTLPSMSAYYMVEEDATLLIVCLVSLASACLSNAVMVSILFELYHRGIRKTTAA